MKLESVSIKGFRGYRTAQTMLVGDITTLVGRNDVGKSSILEALALFFDDPAVKADIHDIHVVRELAGGDCSDLVDGTFEVSCVFVDYPRELVLDAVASTNLKAEFLLTDEDKLQVTKVWRVGKTVSKPQVVVECQHPSSERYGDLLELTNAKLKERLGQCLSEDEVAQVDKRNNPAMRKAIWGSAGKGELRLTAQRIDVSKAGAKDIWQRLSTHLPLFALFQADRPSQDQDGEVQDPMRIAVKNALGAPEVQEQIGAVVDAVRSTTDEVASRTKEVLSEIAPEVAAGLVPQFSDNQNWEKLFKLSLTDDIGVSLNKRGSGVRRLVLLAFFKAEVDRLLKEGSARSVIYAVEEPETSQHPNFQEMLIKTFLEMSEVDGCQIIFTTHSPSLASLVPVESLRFIERSATGMPEIHAATESSPATESLLEKIVESLGMYPPVTGHEAEEVKVVVGVEGPGDVDALFGLSRALREGLSDKYIDLEHDGRVVVIPLGGSSLEHWLSRRYLQRLKVREYHLYDNDRPDYREAAESLGRRGDGSRGRTLGRREMENYVPPSVIERVFGVEVEITDDCDVVEVIHKALMELPHRVHVGKKKIKRAIREVGFSSVSVPELRKAGVLEEVCSWHEDVVDVIEADVQ